MLLLHLFIFYYFSKVKAPSLVISPPPKEEAIVIKIQESPRPNSSMQKRPTPFKTSPHKQPKTSPAPLSWSALEYQPTHQKKESFNTSLETQEKACLQDIILSFVTHYPRVFFLYNIEGSTTLNLHFSSTEIELSSQNFSHQLIDKFSCYQAYQQTLKLKKSHCFEKLTQKNLGKRISIHYQYQLSQEQGVKIKLIKDNQFRVIIRKIKKTGFTRIPMTMINIFSLLELIKGEKDEINMKILLRKLEQFKCSHLKVSL